MLNFTGKDCYLFGMIGLIKGAYFTNVRNKSTVSVLLLILDQVTFHLFQYGCCCLYIERLLTLLNVL